MITSAQRAVGIRSSRALAVMATVFAGAAALRAEPAPAAFIIAAIAGPAHALIEGRYLLRRLVPRWGRQRDYFALALIGWAVLTAAAIAWSVYDRFDWTAGVGARVWACAATLWFAALAWRSRRIDADVLAAGMAAAACIAWLNPTAWFLLLSYAHPLASLVLVDRELVRRRSEMHTVLVAVMACVPLAVVWLWMAPGDEPTQHDELMAVVLARASGSVFDSGIAHRLVPIHALLDVVHYIAWLFLLPAALSHPRAWRPWRLRDVAIATAHPRLRPVIALTLAAAALAVAFQSLAFVLAPADAYRWYFLLVIGHVVAEAPFLLRPP